MKDYTSILIFWSIESLELRERRLESMCSSRLMDFHIKGCKAGGTPHVDLGGMIESSILPLNDHMYNISTTRCQ